MYQYLNFFNTKGEYCNFIYDATTDMWTGRLDFGTMSEGLIESQQIYIMEQVFNNNTKQLEFAFPYVDSSYLPGPYSPVGSTGSTGSTAQSTQITAYFDTKTPVPEIFIYNFSTGTTALLNMEYTANYNFTVDPLQTVAGTASNTPGIKQVNSPQPNALQINFGFMPSGENGFSSTVYLEDIDGNVFAQILLYGEGEEEDERTRDLLQSLGYDLLPSDSIIFYESDVNESKPDWTLINQKRKELLLEYANIFPYLGSYKALINIIKFYGYQNLDMKEYWLNVDPSSRYYGTYKHVDIEKVFGGNGSLNNSNLIPSRTYKKTNKFGLYYDITVATDQYDIDGLPIVEDASSYTPEEVLIKIYALKNKLQQYFLPANAKIVDIIGEAIFFGGYHMNLWNDRQRIDAVSLGLTPTFNVIPGTAGYIQDLRALNFYGCPVGPDLTIGGQTDILSWRIGINPSGAFVGGPLDYVQDYQLNINVPPGTSNDPSDDITIYLHTYIQRDPNTGKVNYSSSDIVNAIIQNWNSNPILVDNFTVYQEGGTSGIMRIVQKSPNSDGSIFAYWSSNTGGVPSNQYTIPSGYGISPVINVSTGPTGTFGPAGAPISYFSDCFLGYFNNINISVSKLNDAPGIPVGCPLILENTTFDLTWDEADVTFNQVDQVNPLTGKLLYASFNHSYDTGFPSNYPSQYTYSWTTLGYYGYYKMQWIVSKPQDTTPAFLFDSGQGNIPDLNSCPIILPYTGKYNVELYLWDGYNTKSFLIYNDWITVDIKDSDFISWYQFRELDYTWDTERYSVQSNYKTLPKWIKQPDVDLTWDEYTSTWDLPLHPNEAIEMAEMSFSSLDSMKFYDTITTPSDNPLIDRYPYTFNLMGSNPTWDDLYHLWWDGTGTTLTQWKIQNVTGSSLTLFMTRGNTVVDINSGLNIYYVDGPTGWTGPVGATSLTGTTAGEIVVSNANRATYIWNGSEWISVIDVVDTFQLTGLSGTPEQIFKSIIYQLNQIMPNDGFDHPFLTDFIYYYDEAYDAYNNLNPFINAVSKCFDRTGRHSISYLGGTGDISSYATEYLGYLGDIPNFFEIYSVPLGPTGTITVVGLTGSSDTYSINSTNLTDLCNELNGPTAQSYNGIGDYSYSLVLGYSGTTGASAIGSSVPVKIQAISNAFTSPDIISVEYTGGINGVTYGRSLIRNPTWDELRILKYSQELPLCTVVNFTYDNSKINGKGSPIWILHKEGDPQFEDIYYYNQYFSYMFNETGSFTITLQLFDTNGNTQTITKTELIKIV